MNNYPKTGRNEPCPCGSKKKYKKCCGASLSTHIPSTQNLEASDINNMLQYGLKLLRSNDLKQAKSVFKKVLTGNPRHADTLNYLGSIEASFGNIDQATRFFERAIALKPRNYNYYNNFGYALELNKRYAEAIEILKRSIELNPGYSRAYLNLGNAYKGIDDISMAYKCYQKSLQIQPDLFLACSNLLYLSNTLPYYTNKEIYKLHTENIAIFKENNSRFIAPHKNSPDPQRKLRIGYMSSDFREHSCSYFIEPILNNHDPEKFELYAYYNYTAIDNTTERIQKYFDVWRVTANHSDKEIAEAIRADNIDILIDLSGYTAHSPVLVLTHRPAPVQISWMGYPNTTGITDAGYRITDSYSDPVDSAGEFYTETLLRMPDCFLVYKPPTDAPNVAEIPFKKNGFITFGSFNNNVKINEKVISLWSKILKSIPDSKLLLKSAGFDNNEVRKKLFKQFETQNIREDRIILSGKMESTRDHLMLYNKVDIGLDTFPYNGTTTTYEALWMGVPVITLKGDCHRARVGTSILCNVKLSEWVAENEDEYIAIAKKMASETALLDTLRKRMRMQMKESPLMNTAGFTQQLERKLGEIWATWCRKV